MLDKEDFIGSLSYIDEVSDEKQDIKYFELKKFLSLLLTNNPNIIELLNMPEDCILFKHELYNLIKKEDFLSKKCKDSFGGYAFSQIKKAKGLNKKITLTMPPEKKSLLDFCIVIIGSKTFNLKDWLNLNSYHQKFCGLSKADNMRDIYFLYYDLDSQNQGLESSPFLKGILRDESHTNLLLSAVPKSFRENRSALIYYNEDGYSKYLKDYREYKIWEKNRNEERYKKNIDNEKNYDSKNMAHCMRLIETGIDIAEKKDIIVRRENKAFLLDVLNAKYDYNELMDFANKKLELMESAYEKSDLQDAPNYEKTEALHYQIRKIFYNLT